MPQSCSACKNRHTLETRSRGITFHKFPKEKQLRRQWELSVRKEASLYSVLCSEHFKPEDFDRTGQTVRIRDGVKPSIFSYRTRRQKKLASRMKQDFPETEESKPVDYSIPKKSSTTVPPDVTPAPPKLNLDHIYALPTSPAVLKARLHGALSRVESMQREIRNLKDRERRTKKTIDNLQKDLKKKNIANRRLRDKLKVYSEIPIDLLLRKGHEYTEDQKEFALNLHLQGPKAYNYLRKVLHLDLPHPHTLLRWKSSTESKSEFKAGDTIPVDVSNNTEEEEEVPDDQNVPILSTLEELQELGINVVWTMDGDASDVNQYIQLTD